jgi:methionyl-tRNA synthetase
MLLAPYLPFTSQRLHEMLGYRGQLFGRQYTQTFDERLRSHIALSYDHRQAAGKWEPSQLPAGQEMGQPAPLFKKLDDDVVDKELARLIGAS